MKRSAVKLASGDWSIRNEHGTELYIIRKHYRNDRSKNHDGYDKITRLNTGEYVQLPYFSHYATLKQALRCCGC